MAHDLVPIYAELAPKVAGYLRVQGLDDPESAANEVFLRAFRAIDGFSGSGDALRSWIFAIAHNLVIDDRRRRGRRPRLDPVADVPDHASGGPGVGDLVGSAARLVELLDELPDDQRDVVVLRILSDLSIAATAELLGKRPGAVKALQHRALARLRRRFDDEAVSRGDSSTFTRT